MKNAFQIWLVPTTKSQHARKNARQQIKEIFANLDRNSHRKDALEYNQTTTQNKNTSLPPNNLINSTMKTYLLR